MSSPSSSSPRADVTETELAVMQQLWERGPRTVRQLADALYPGGEAAHYGTVQKLLQRLQAKRCVGRVARRTPIEFVAKVTREALADLRLRQLVDTLCAGSLTPLLSHLTRRRELTAAERQELEKFMQDLEARQDAAARKKR